MAAVMVRPPPATTTTVAPLRIASRVARAAPLGDTLDIAPTTEALHDANVLVFYTDGATDVPRHSLDERQWTDLVATACRPAGTAEEIADNIRDSLEEVLPFAQRNDDIALLVLKVVGDPI